MVATLVIPKVTQFSNQFQSITTLRVWKWQLLCLLKLHFASMFSRCRLFFNFSNFNATTSSVHIISAAVFSHSFSTVPRVPTRGMLSEVTHRRRWSGDLSAATFSITILLFRSEGMVFVSSGLIQIKHKYLWRHRLRLVSLSQFHWSFRM